MTDIELAFYDGYGNNVCFGNATSSTDGVITEYVPSTPPIGATSHIDSARVTFTDSSIPQGTAVSRINQIGTRARDYHKYKIGNPCSLILTIGSGIYQTELFDIRFEPDEDVLNFELADGVVSGTLIWERQPFMEGSATLTLTLTNDALNETTDGGAVVHMLNDNTIDTDGFRAMNSVDIADFVGDLPTPVEITLESTDPYALSDLFLCTYVRTSTNTEGYDMNFEAELADPSSDVTSTTDTADATMSLNKYMRVVSSPHGAWIGQLSWHIVSADLIRYAGAIYKPIVLWKTAPAYDISVKLRFKSYTGYVIAETQPVTIESTDGDYVTMLSNTKIPPFQNDAYGDASSTDSGLDMELCVYYASTDAITLDIDALYLFRMDTGKICEQLFAPPVYQKFIDPNGVTTSTIISPFSAVDIGGAAPRSFQTHIATGSQQLLIYPGFPNSIAYASLNPGAAPDTVKAKMTAVYRPRWRM